MEPRVLNPLRPVFDAYNKGSPEERERIRVIGVMGLTGTGKSTFIKKLTNDRNIIIGDDLSSQTMDVALSRMNFLACSNKSYDVFFADTPGFDDSSRSDTDVLRNIVTWLGAMRDVSIKLSGIIYLHRITDPRVGGTAWRNLRLLESLVGADKMANVVLVSTRWEEQPLTEPDAWRARMEGRQKQLEQGFLDRSGTPRQGFWQTYIENGARVMRHDGSVDSARRIVDNIIIFSTPIYIQIQDEVFAGKDLSQTAAGQEIKADLEKSTEKTSEELAKLKEELATLRGEMEGRRKAQEEARLRQQFEEEIALMQEKMRTELEEQKRMYEATNQALRDDITRLNFKVFPPFLDDNGKCKTS